MISTQSSPVVPYGVIERYRQDDCKIGIRFFSNNTNTPADLTGKTFEFSILDNDTAVLVIEDAAIVRTAANRLEIALSTEQKQLLRKARYTYRLFNTTSGLTETEGVFSWIKAKPTRTTGPQVPPDLAIIYQATTGMTEAMLILQGLQGFKGWSALLANVQDGERVVQQIAGWTGGEGTAPATGSYLGSNGLVSDIAQARNIRGRGFWPRGTWAATTTYSVDDIVTYQGSTYRCQTAHTSGATFSPANWELWSRGLNFRGAWAATTAYSDTDLVTFQGSTYRRLAAGTSGSTFDRSEWELWARGLNFRGAWAASTAYSETDLVTYNGTTWRRLAVGTSGSTFDSANWEVWAQGLNFRGAWVANTAYAVNDVVTYRGSTWRRNSAGTSATFDVAGYTQIARGLNFRGAWTASTPYEVDDVFTNAGSTYRVTAPFTSGVSFSAANTEVLAAGANISDDASLGGNTPSTTNGISQRVAKTIRDAMPNLHRIRVVENLISWSEDLANAAWTKIRCTPTYNVGVAPDGFMTATRLVEDTQSGNHGASAGNVSLTIGDAVTFSVYAKAETRRYVMLTTTNANPFGGSFPGVAFDLQTGTAIAVNPITQSYTITAIGGGWYRLTMTAVATVANSTGISLVAHNGTTNLFAGDGVSSFLLWGFQISKSDQPTEYVKTENNPVSRTVNTRLDKRAENSTVYAENLFRYSDGFLLDSWDRAQVDVTLNSMAPPTGYTSVYRVVTNTNNSDHYIRQQSDFQAGVRYAYTVVAKAGELGFLRLGLGITAFSNTSYFGYFDLVNGVLGSRSGVEDMFIQPLGSGWYRCTIVATALVTALADVAPANNAVTIRFGATDNFAITFAGDGVSGAYLSAAQLSVGRLPLPYVRTFAFPVWAGVSVSRPYVDSTFRNVHRAASIENLISRSNLFTSPLSSVVGMTVITAAAVGPFGANSMATRLVESANNEVHNFAKNADVIPAGNTLYCVSLFIKKETKATFAFGTSGSAQWQGGNAFTFVDLNAGTITFTNSVNNTARCGIADVGNGWYRVWIAHTTVASPTGGISFNFNFFQSASSQTNSYLGDGVSSVLIFGSQINEGETPNEYVETGANGFTKQLRQVLDDSTLGGGSPSVIHPPSQAAVKAAVELRALLNSPVTTVTANSFTLAVADNGAEIQYDATATGVCNIPTNATAAIPVGAMIQITQINSGPITVVGAAGVTVRSKGNFTRTMRQGDSLTLVKTGTNTWNVRGDLCMPLDLTNAHSAWGLRRMLDAYTGALLRVRRASDSAETDVFADSAGNVSAMSLTSSNQRLGDWAGGSNLFVRTIYNQLNSLHFSNTVAAEQPQLFLSGGTRNGGAFVRFTSSASRMTAGVAADWKFIHDGTGATLDFLYSNQAGYTTGRRPILCTASAGAQVGFCISRNGATEYSHEFTVLIGTSGQSAIAFQRSGTAAERVVMRHLSSNNPVIVAQTSTGSSGQASYSNAPSSANPAAPLTLGGLNAVDGLGFDFEGLTVFKSFISDNDVQLIR